MDNRTLDDIINILKEKVLKDNKAFSNNDYDNMFMQMCQFTHDDKVSLKNNFIEINKESLLESFRFMMIAGYTEAILDVLELYSQNEGTNVLKDDLELERKLRTKRKKLKDPFSFNE